MTAGGGGLSGEDDDDSRDYDGCMNGERDGDVVQIGQDHDGTCENLSIDIVQAELCADDKGCDTGGVWRVTMSQVRYSRLYQMLWFRV